ncbi:large conductance mechanosensitive channel protein MscL [Desertibaculum subflavum]|uniref:large conductance mechanosensitive channel protein MscL n=1 Tax=Desertibaculum subflavum TaxID=2268458 RepID=UPI000E67234B
MLNEFKTFIMRGNVVDLAVGIIIGAAFTAIVNSLVNDIIMPPIGFILGGVDFTNFFLTIKGEALPTLEETKKAGSVVIAYGAFLNAVIQFLIIAFAVFLLVKGINRMRDMAIKQQQSDPGPPPPLPADVVLLTEIRDLLKAR